MHCPPGRWRRMAAALLGFSNMQGFVYMPTILFHYQFFNGNQGKIYSEAHALFPAALWPKRPSQLVCLISRSGSAFSSPTLCLLREGSAHTSPFDVSSKGATMMGPLQMQRMFRRLWVAANRAGSPFNPISGSAQWACPAHCGQRPLFICFYQPQNQLSEKWNFAPSDCTNNHQKTNEEIV